jgi:regulator of RNase E activity RraA
MTVRTVAFFLSAATLASAAPIAAQPPASATCDVLEVSGTTEKTPSIDPELTPLEKRRKTVVGSANTFKQLSRQSTFWSPYAISTDGAGELILARSPLQS